MNHAEVGQRRARPRLLALTVAVTYLVRYP